MFLQMNLVFILHGLGLVSCVALSPAEQCYTHAPLSVTSCARRCEQCSPPRRGAVALITSSLDGLGGTAGTGARRRALRAQRCGGQGLQVGVEESHILGEWCSGLGCRGRSLGRDVASFGSLRKSVSGPHTVRTVPAVSGGKVPQSPARAAGSARRPVTGGRPSLSVVCPCCR